jgi:hypothetical protein
MLKHAIKMLPNIMLLKETDFKSYLSSLTWVE